MLAKVQGITPRDMQLKNFRCGLNEQESACQPEFREASNYHCQLQRCSRPRRVALPLVCASAARFEEGQVKA